MTVSSSIPTYSFLDDWDQEHQLTIAEAEEVFGPDFMDRLVIENSEF